ncbi:MAG: hypothetical protein COZ76_11415 [Flavobacteriales bacterium CG_4_8_14_3_um_filter_35_10]|nr:MAG: hypothetical protein COZ76_11415 [Flavobacteriales bacterium CG_4_8_14_3_um_filter_35_10]PJA06211.1 MAG: hypothetical protein COX71_02970 [Flavobacteriales bacterium CG_4_10_14_0_2_um_filter_35_18]
MTKSIIKSSVFLLILSSLASCNSVVAYLTKKGVDKNRLTAKGFGPSSPIADNKTAEGRAKNRCVVMKIMAKN